MAALMESWNSAVVGVRVSNVDITTYVNAPCSAKFDSISGTAARTQESRYDSRNSAVESFSDWNMEITIQTDHILNLDLLTMLQLDDQDCHPAAMQQYRG